MSNFVPNTVPEMSDFKDINDEIHNPSHEIIEIKVGPDYFGMSYIIRWNWDTVKWDRTDLPYERKYDMRSRS
jgi:hypothetical protein